MPNTQHNGWTNYETWAVNLWLENDEQTLAWLDELVGDDTEPYDKAKRLEDQIFMDIPEGCREASMYSDLLTASLQMVDWQEIVRHGIERYYS